jgi:hypothetical protein
MRFESPHSIRNKSLSDLIFRCTSKLGQPIGMATRLMVVVEDWVVSLPLIERFTMRTNHIADAKDLYFKNLKTQGLRSGAVTISQCTRFSGAPGVGNCTNSQFQIRDVTIDGLVGTTIDDRVGSFQCSAVAPCTNIGLFGVDLKLANGTAASSYLCGNVVSPRGFKCTGPVCVGGSATGGC